MIVTAWHRAPLSILLNVEKRATQKTRNNKIHWTIVCIKSKRGPYKKDSQEENVMMAVVFFHLFTFRSIGSVVQVSNVGSFSNIRKNVSEIFEILSKL